MEDSWENRTCLGQEICGKFGGVRKRLLTFFGKLTLAMKFKYTRYTTGDPTLKPVNGVDVRIIC